MAVSIQEVQDQWKVDSAYNITKLDDNLFRSPLLHSKYLEYYMYFRAKQIKAQKNYNLMLWQKRKYWRGEMEKHELEKYGWSQWQGLKPTGGEFNLLVDADRELNDLLELLEVYKAAVEALEKIMKQISSRDWAIKSAIDYQKFQAGGY